ncbi:D-alanyl-D-alanine carboxypeptidase [Streptomyces sp. 3212.3]|uniref:serine hydrolase domain-containing protein n=1 Tax=unclassified Streptomyces TaxID=2593676 RepID=UPI000E285DF2|nr:serine hydrolase domain-containing protein [Streptomyces sp. 3212.3]REE64761.1 D-alanyl-D-alanine carboxypeptidase [Streptomyces sp. 3212.3]
MTHSRGRLRRAAATVATAGTLLLPLVAAATFGMPEPDTNAVTVALPHLPPDASPLATQDVRELTPDVRRQLDAAVRRVMREADVPGVTVGLWMADRGKYVRSFGVADKADGKRMSRNLDMRIGSETKTFTVTALLQLVDLGRAGLDDPIWKYVDGVPNGDRITLRDLAGMRSGLFNYSEDDGFYRALTSDPRRSFTPRQLLDYSFGHPVQFSPGEKFDYCNTNLVLLGLVVEKVSGERLGDFIEKNVLAPAGLDHTSFPSDAAFPAQHAQGYTDQTASGKTEDATDWNPSWGWAAGAMISDLHDLSVWARTVATGTLPNGGPLISPALQKQRLTTPPTAIRGAGYGLGIFNVRGWLGHNGSLPGYESLTVYLPSARATLVILLNTDVDHDGQEPSTLFGEAVTRIATPGHVFDLRAQPAAR